MIFRRPAVILGIETSCDDTGCAIVDSNGRILGENKHSQLQFHLRFVPLNAIFELIMVHSGSNGQNSTNIGINSIKNEFNLNVWLFCLRKFVVISKIPYQISEPAA